jgi:hypothetical protein
VILYLRKIVFGFILVFFSEIPFAQLSLILIQHLVMVILYVVLKPYSSSIKNVLMAVTEFGMLIGISIIFFLIDDKQSDPESERVK